jgi:hypothetical protein
MEANMGSHLIDIRVKARPVIWTYPCDTPVPPDILDRFPGYDPEGGIDVVELTCRLVKEEVRAAYDRMAPLLEPMGLRLFEIYVELAECPSDESPLAILHYTWGQQAFGEYVFTSTRRLTDHYLKARMDPSYELSLMTRLAWDHELMHVADIENVRQVDRLVEEGSRESMSLVHILQFRLEGVADLHYWMASDTALTDMDQAFCFFVLDRRRVRDLFDRQVDGKYARLLGQIRRNPVFYHTGALMVVHLLARVGCPEASDAALRVLHMKRQKLRIPEELWTSLLWHALALDNDTFLEGYGPWFRPFGRGQYPIGPTPTMK